MTDEEELMSSVVDMAKESLALKGRFDDMKVDRNCLAKRVEELEAEKAQDFKLWRHAELDAKEMSAAMQDLQAICTKQDQALGEIRRGKMPEDGSRYDVMAARLVGIARRALDRDTVWDEATPTGNK